MESSTASHPSSAGADDATAAVAERIWRSRRSSEWAILALSTGVVVASVVLTPSAEAVSLFGWDIPPLCLFSNLTGMDCFGCGLTRSFTYMGHGDVAAAFARHMLGPLFYVLVVAQVPLRTWRLWQTRRIGASFPQG